MSLFEILFGVVAVAGLLVGLVGWGRLEWHEMQRRCLCDETTDPDDPEAPVELTEFNGIRPGMSVRYTAPIRCPVRSSWTGSSASATGTSRRPLSAHGGLAGALRPLDACVARPEAARRRGAWQDRNDGQSEDGRWTFRWATTEAEPSLRRTCSNGSFVTCREAEAAIAGYQEMLAIAQRQGMTYEQEWMPGQIARLQVTVNEIAVLWPEAATAELATSAV